VKTKDQILHFLAQNKELFRENYHIVRIGLFGSYARSEQNFNSDVDLLVEFEENTQELFELKLQIKAFFKASLDLDVDICREKYINPRIKKAILKETVYAD
jgi:uncharacterized protein